MSLIGSLLRIGKIGTVPFTMKVGTGSLSGTFMKNRWWRTYPESLRLKNWAGM